MMGAGLGSMLEMRAVGVVAFGGVVLGGLRVVARLRVRRRAARLVALPARHPSLWLGDGQSRRRATSWSRRLLGSLGPRFRWVGAGSEAEHAELLEAVARSLRSGASLVTALEHAASTRRGCAADELDGALVIVRNGASLDSALDVWAAGMDPARTVAGAALALGAQLGGARARALDDAALGLRDRAALTGEIRALTSQARASAAVMVLAPVAFAFFGWFADAGVTSVFTTPLGAACVVGGLALDAAGAWWMAVWTRRVA